MPSERRRQPYWLPGLVWLFCLCSAPAWAQAVDYHGKLTVITYRAADTSNADVNVRYSAGDWTGWLEWYGPDAGTRQARTGLEYDFRRRWLVLTPSAQAASRSFLGGSVYAEIGTRVYLFAGVSLTNLNPYINLSFDPNESWQAGAGLHWAGSDSLAAYTIWDNRLGTGQQNTHVVLRHHMANARRLTLDASAKSGRGDSGVPVTGHAEAAEYDVGRWFVKLARERAPNFETGITMWRAGGGFRF